jgi:hypothetical protein
MLHVLKFQQNPGLMKVLKSTNKSIMVEASPYDKIWGIGLGIESPVLNDKTKWKVFNENK